MIIGQDVKHAWEEDTLKPRVFQRKKKGEEKKSDVEVVNLDGSVVPGTGLQDSEGVSSAAAKGDDTSPGGGVQVAATVDADESAEQDLAKGLSKFNKALPTDKHEKESAKELYDEMSEEYKKYIAEKVKALPIVRYTRRAPFTEDEKKLIAAGLMSRTPIYKIAQTLRCSHTKVDNAIQSDEFLHELAVESILREKEEIQEGIDDCVRARNPAVIMWAAQHLMPEKYGDQVNLDNEDDTRLVIGAIPDEEVSEAENIVDAMKDQVPIVPTPALIEANEIQAEMQAAGFGVSSVPLSQTPATPAVFPPPGDTRFRPLVSAGEMNTVDENGNVVHRATTEEPDASHNDGMPDNYDAFNGESFDGFGGGESWI